MATFTVVLRGRSTLRFEPEGYLHLRDLNTPEGRVQVVYRTRRAETEGFSKPVPRGLWVEVQGEASSIDAALNAFPQAAEAFLPTLTFCFNAPTETLLPELAFESSPGAHVRPFFQLFAPDYPLRPGRPRPVNALVFGNVMQALTAHGKSARIGRALAHYHHALQNWIPGHEIMALAHLWMSLECLTKVALERLTTVFGCTAAELAARWEVGLQDLDGQVRLRELLQGDGELYRKAKAASDGFEHGFMEIARLRTTSATYKTRLASAVRRAIARELALDSETMEQVFAPAHEQPAPFLVRKYLRTELVGELEALPEPGQHYPLFAWKTINEEGPAEESGDPTLKITESVRARVGEGVTHRNVTFEMWAF